MTKAVGVALAALLAVGSVAIAVVSATTKAQAHSTLESAHRLYEARLGVMKAEEALGGSDLDTAVESAGRANATAEKVKTITTDIADLLASAEAAARATSSTSKRAVENVTLTRRQTGATSDVLAVIAEYQQAASAFADDTNAALRRILRALRKTNRSFPGGGP